MIQSRDTEGSSAPSSDNVTCLDLAASSPKAATVVVLAGAVVVVLPLVVITVWLLSLHHRRRPATHPDPLRHPSGPGDTAILKKSRRLTLAFFNVPSEGSGS
jgi:hypothetical protein